MDFTILAVVLLIGVGVPIRNKLIRKYRDKKKQEDNKDKLKCRMIMGAADRQKRIEQGDTECHGHNINQIVLHRPLCIFENEFSVHRSCPLPSW